MAGRQARRALGGAEQTACAIWVRCLRGYLCGYLQARLSRRHQLLLSSRAPCSPPVPPPGPCRHRMSRAGKRSDQAGHWRCDRRMQGPLACAARVRPEQCGRDCEWRCWLLAARACACAGACAWPWLPHPRHSLAEKRNQVDMHWQRQRQAGTRHVLAQRLCSSVRRKPVPGRYVREASSVC